MKDADEVRELRKYARHFLKWMVGERWLIGYIAACSDVLEGEFAKKEECVEA